MSLVFDYSGKRVLVTGGSQGIGLGIASAFADAGAEVHITGTRADPQTYKADLSRFTYHQARMENPAERVVLAQAFDELDILINNAGTAGDDEYSQAGFERIMEINLNAVADMCFRLHPQLTAARGAIVNLCSVGSHIALRDRPAYTASKTGLLGFTRSIADKWARDGIRVNAVAPGFIDTQIIDWARSDESLSDQFLRAIPARRVGRPDEVASAVLFLASAQAAYIVGQALVIDGGYLLR